MRSSFSKQAGFQVFAVAGVENVSFGITAAETTRPRFLGFAVTATGSSCCVLPRHTRDDL